MTRHTITPSISVSSDSVVWKTVWENETAVTDSVWTLVEYDISEVADGEPIVYIRWTMGPTDLSEKFCGWNIDDIEIWAADMEPPVSFDFETFSNYPNPCNPATTFLYELPERAQARLAVYDLTGRLVRVVEDRLVGPGWRVVEWDGRNEGGVPVASGVYFSRLEAGRLAQTRKVVVVK